MLLYILKMALISGSLFALYLLLLQNRKTNTWNRVVLLGIVVLSLLLPLLRINTSSGTWTQYRQTGIQMLQPVLVQASRWQPWWQQVNWVSAVYVIVTVVLLLRFTLGLWHIYRLGRKHEASIIEKDMRLVHVPQLTAPFSFGKTVYADRDLLLQPAQRLILLHEQAHIHQKHTADKLFMELLCAVGWINPVFWLIKKELTLVHEFLADEAAMQEAPQQEYASVLLQQAMPAHALMAHHFFHHPIKRRILMMYQQKTKAGWRKAALLGGIAVLSTMVLVLQSNHIGLANFKNIAGAQSGIFNVVKDGPDNADKPSAAAEKADTVIVNDYTAAAAKKFGEESPVAQADSKTYDKVDQEPAFPGGQDALMHFLSKNITYPEQAQKEGIEGQVVVQFIVDKSGKPRDFKVVRPVNPLLDAEALRVLGLMPGWTPGKQKGEAVNVLYNLPIRFKMDDSKEKKG